MPLPHYAIVCRDCGAAIATCACPVEKVVAYQQCRVCEAKERTAAAAACRTGQK